MKRKLGITLVEVMVACSLFAVVTIPLYMAMREATHKTNITMARSYVKQEANKVLRFLENDLSQARKSTYKQEGNTITVMVQKDKKHNAELKYVYTKPNLHRYFDGKCWLITNILDYLDVAPSIEGTPGKMVANIIMKSDLPGILPNEQPIFEEQKIIMLMEDATEENDPNWRDVGDVSKFFQTHGDLMKGIKEDCKQLVQNFADVWGEALGDIKNMTVGQLKEVFSSLKDNLADCKKNLMDINRDISDLEWEALYDRSGFFGSLFGANKRKERSANKVKALVAGYKSADEMNWEQVKSTARSDMKEDAIKAMFDAKKQLFDGGAQIQENLKKVEEESGADLGYSTIDFSFLGGGEKK